MPWHRYAQPVENYQCVTTAFFFFNLNVGILRPFPELLEDLSTLSHEISLGELDTSKGKHS